MGVGKRERGVMGGAPPGNVGDKVGAKLFGEGVVAATRTQKRMPRFTYQGLDHAHQEYASSRMNRRVNWYQHPRVRSKNNIKNSSNARGRLAFRAQLPNLPPLKNNFFGELLGYSVKPDPVPANPKPVAGMQAGKPIGQDN